MSKIPPLIAACLFSLSLDDGAIQLFPAGSFDAPRGSLRGSGPWQLNAQSAQALIAQVSQRFNDTLIDYEHQSLHSAKNGLPVVAAGWIDGKSLEWREGSGLFARQVNWTAAATAHIEADEYRYLSPVFSYDAITGDVLDIINVALTNSPAIDNMQAVALAATSFIASTLPTESVMDDIKERLCYVLNLPALTTDAELLAELDKLKALLASGSPVDAATSLHELLTAKNTEIAALTASVSAEVDPAKYVPISVVTELRHHLAALSLTAQSDQVERMIEEGAAQGKIIGPAEKNWATALGKKDIAALSSYLESAHPIAALSGMQTRGNEPAALAVAATVTADEQSVATALGLSHQEMINQRSAK